MMNKNYYRSCWISEITTENVDSTSEYFEKRETKILVIEIIPQTLFLQLGDLVKQASVEAY